MAARVAPRACPACSAGSFPATMRSAVITPSVSGCGCRNDLVPCVARRVTREERDALLSPGRFRLPVRNRGIACRQPEGDELGAVDAAKGHDNILVAAQQVGHRRPGLRLGYEHPPLLLARGLVAGAQPRAPPPRFIRD